MHEDAVVETKHFGEMEHFSQILSLLVSLSILRITTAKPLDSFEDPDACSGRWKALYRGTCETLLQQGPCGNTEWLILDNDGVPHCADRPCQLDKTTDQSRLLAPMNNVCVREGDTEPCPDGMEIVLLENGQAECECQTGFVYWAPKNDLNKGACYQPFYRGPCAKGQMLYLPPLREGRVRAKCLENRCGADAVEVQLLANGTAIVVESYTGECAQLNAENAVCARIYKRSHLTVDPHTMELTCSQPAEVAMMRDKSRSTRTTLPNQCSYGVKTTQKNDCRSAALWYISG